MYIKIIFTVLAILSILLLVWFLIVGNNSQPFTNLPNENTPEGSSFPTIKNQREEDIIRIPGTIASFKETDISDRAIVQNNTVAEVAKDFFELTEDKNLYGLYYDSVSGNITITLYGLDTKKSRASAEDYILGELPYTKDQWCNFVVRVLTNEYENPQLAGQELGLSFCPGSVQL